MNRSNIQLLEIESGKVSKYLTSITTISYFSGQLHQCVDDIKERYKLVVQHNPWLVGHLVQANENDRVVLNYPHSCESLDEVFLVNPDGVTISSDTTYTELYDLLDVAIIKSPKYILNRQTPVSRLTLVNISEDSFCFIYSLSHSVADGHTYYKLLNMLSFDEDVYALNYRRKDLLEAMMKKSITDKVYDYFTGIPHIINALLGLSFGKKTSVYAFYIDNKKIDKIKSVTCNETECEYVSTNDILSSGFAKFVKARLLLMAINFRGKLAQLHDNDAGNYESIVMYDELHYSCPATIRKSLMNRPYIGLAKQVPGVLEAIFCKMGFITNWSSFSKPLKLKGAKEVLHLPLNCSSGRMPYDVAIIFRAKEDQHAMMFYSGRFNKASFEDSDLPLGQLISEKMFV
jgi:hypothetical protein